MSWIFGGGKGDDKSPIKLSDFYLGQASQGGAGGPPKSPTDAFKPNEDSGRKSSYSFDSEALERAAKAAKELESNKNAKEIMELVREQEKTRMMEMKLQMEQMKQQAQQKDHEYRRQAMKEQAELEKQKAQYNDQLARKRMEDQIAMQQKQNEDKLRQEEEALARREALRKASIEHEYEQKRKVEIEREKARVEAETKKERQNKDVLFEKLKLEAAEQRETALARLNSLTGILGSGMDVLLTDKAKLAQFCLGITGVFGGYFVLKGATRVGYNYLEARLATPSLVQDTSRLSPLDVLKHPIKSMKKLKTSQKDVMEGIIMDPRVETELRDIAIRCKITSKNNLFHRNLLLYGPPGTGKTLFAKQLARHSGMHYAILSGGDVQGLGSQAIIEMRKVFDWGETSRKGLIIFIDEVESFLSDRMTLDNEMKHVVSMFLHRTGTENKKSMLVLATNTPTVLDHAVLSRVGVPLQVPLPKLEERKRLIFHYFDKYVLTPVSEGKMRFKVEPFDYKQVCTDVAEMTEGLSGRDLSYLALEWQKIGSSSGEGILTKDDLLNTVKNTMKSRNLLDDFVAKQKSDLSQSWSQAVVNKAKKEYGDQSK